MDESPPFMYSCTYAGLLWSLSGTSARPVNV
jgi:hypothetical protein